MKKNKFIAPTFVLFALFLQSFPAWAQIGVENITTNIINSSSSLPGLVSAFMYIAGLILLITGVIKLKEHVDNERQTPIRVPVIRLIAGGMCLALPLITQATVNAINGGNFFTFASHTSGASYFITGTAALVSAVGSMGTNISAIFTNIGIFASDTVGLVPVIAYLLALILTASGILKLKEHVEEPEKVTIKEPVTRFLTAGALFGLPFVFDALYNTISGTGSGLWGTVMGAFTISQFLYSSYEDGSLGMGSTCVGTVVAALNSLGTVLCSLQVAVIGLPGFLMGIGYLLGTILVLWGILKLRDHVLSPTQTKLSEGVTRMFAGGAFFTLPVLTQALQSTVTPVTLAGTSIDSTTSFAGSLTCTGPAAGLDQAFGCFMLNIMGPSQMLLNFFAFCAGLIFMMVGISRLIKSAQDGPRGPGGLGTIATFVAAGVLMSGTTLMSTLSASLFSPSYILSGGKVATKVTAMGFTGGMSAAEVTATHNTISAVIRFMIMIGLISFVRGVFILRDSAEGKSQASVMSGMTHIIGGALAVNLGPLLNTIQYTLGISTFGITFG